MSLDYQDFNATQHLNEQRQLYANCFPESHVVSGAETDHYFWKFRGLGSSYEYSAWEESRLLGYYAALPYTYRVDDKNVVCGMVCDVMTHPEARGKGVFTGLGRYSLTRLQASGVGFVSGYPIRPQVLPGHLKVGWFVAFKLPLYAKILKLRFFYWRKLSSAYHFENLSIEDFLKLNQYDEFFSVWSQGQKNHLIKDRAFLKWRLGAPRATYNATLVWKENKIVAVAFTRKVNFASISCLALIDFMVLPNEIQAIKSLHRALEVLGVKLKTDLIVTMMSPTTGQRNQILRHGFMRTPKEFKLILNRLDKSLKLESLAEEKNWNLTWIDSDDN